MFDLANRASAGASGARRREIRSRDAMGKEIERRRRSVSFCRRKEGDGRVRVQDGLAYWAKTWEWAEYQ